MNFDWSLRDPIWLLMLVLLPGAMWWRRRRSFTVWLVPFAAAWHRVGPEHLNLRTWLALAATGSGLILIVVALARPQRLQERWITQTKGYDIILAIDLSPSMAMEDHVRGGDRVSRFESIRPIIRGFVERRPNDRIGIIVFSGRAYTLSPLTFDHDWLSRQIDRLQVGMIGEGTAIGDAVVLGLQRLRQPERESAGRRQGAAIVLITDGVNNSGLFTPKEARTLAAERGVPVCTISAGREGWFEVPYTNSLGHFKLRHVKAEVDETELWIMAIGTGGEFYRGHDQSTLVRAFNAISQRRKIEFSSRRLVLTQELFPWFAAPAIGLFIIGGILTFRQRLTWMGAIQPEDAKQLNH